MNKRYYLLLILILTIALVITGCGSETTQLENTFSTKNAVEVAKEDIQAYYEENAEMLETLAIKFLGLLEEYEVSTAQYNIAADRLELYGGDNIILENAQHPELEKFLPTLVQEQSTIRSITAGASMHYFNSRTCAFDASISVDGEPFYYLALVYCETPDAMVNFPELTEQIAPKWYIVGYEYPIPF